MPNKKKPEYSGPEGGLGFFLTWLCSIALAVNVLLIIPQLEFISENWLALLAGTVIGIFLTVNFIKNEISVLLHEFKHSLISNFVGNKAKSLKIKKDHGHFEYSYTKDTAGHNAFISLAPYWLPVFSFPVTAISFFTIEKFPDLTRLVIGITLAIDLVSALRDAHPNQTDLIRIMGGRFVSYIFIISMNISVIFFVSCLANLGGKDFIYQFWLGLKSIYLLGIN